MKLLSDTSHSTAHTRFPFIVRVYDWLPMLLMLVLLAISGAAVAQTWQGESFWRFPLIAVISGVFASVLGRTRIHDGTAISISMAVGVATVWILTATSSGYLEGGLRTQLQSFSQPLVDALIHNQFTGANRDLAAETLLSLAVWLSAWISMWLLVRAGFVWLALLGPSVLILVNQQIVDKVSHGLSIAMVALSLMVIVLHRLRTRQRQWEQHHADVSHSVLSRGLAVALTITLLVSSTLFVAPEAWSQTILKPMVEQSVERLESMRLDTLIWVDGLFGTSITPAGRYTEFSDGYSIGGPLSLTAEPEVLVQVDSENAPYLKARTYDEYTGRGWVSSSSGTFVDADDSARRSPELRYNANWEVALSTEARKERDQITAHVSPLNEVSQVVLSVESFLTADVQTVVRMSWTTVVDLPLPVTVNTLNQLPPDVQLLGSLLLQSDLRKSESALGPRATSDVMQAAIDTEVEDLQRRGIDVRWTATSDGIVDTILVSGHLPVFDDVESVFRSPSVSSASDYRVTSLTSVASVDQLMVAGTDYPEWVSDRYLQLGDSVTDRTLQLTRDIVGDETNVYLQSELIEEWLRTNIVYDDTVEAPPGDQDVVDYVLFDNRNGYCEHYSAAMTVMLRSLGVPTRVAVGYSPGTWEDSAGAFIYRQNNAHAWVEVFFPGYGWIPFEPTANRPLGEFDLEAADRTDSENQPEAIDPEPTEAAQPTAEIATPDVDVDNSLATPQPTPDTVQAPPTVIDSPPSGGIPPWLLATGGVVTLLSAGAGVAWVLWSWSLRDLAPAQGLMRRMQRVGTWLGVRSSSTTTPREYARKFEKEASGLSAPVRDITRAYEIEAFGPRAARDQVMADASRSWNEIKRHLFWLIRHRRK